MTDDATPRPLAVPPRRASKLVYLGTPEMAVAPLRALHAAGHDIVLAVSRADKRRGRGSERQPSPVKRAAGELGIPVTDELDDALDVGADLGVVVAYGRIIPRRVLERLPMINLHFSLLPRWRGAAPVERAILAGDTATGVAVMAVEEGLDTGGIYAEATVPIGPDQSADELRADLVRTGSDLLVRVLANGLDQPTAQVGDAVYAAKLDAAELEIDWHAPAVEVHRLVRVGGAWTTFRGKRLKVWQIRVLAEEAAPDAGSSLAPGSLDALAVATGAGWVELVEVQPEGRARQPAMAWRNGARPSPDERLGL